MERVQTPHRFIHRGVGVLGVDHSERYVSDADVFLRLDFLPGFLRGFLRGFLLGGELV